MSEVETVEPLEVETPEPEVTEPTYTPEEEKAMAHGWKPKDQYDGPEDNWRSAREFNDRASLFEHINNQKKEIRELRDGLSTVIKQERKRADKLIQEEIERLKEEKKEAYINEDFNKVVEIDDQIAVKKEEAKNTANSPDPFPVVTNDRTGNVAANNAWMNANSGWYEKDEDLTIEADMYFEQYLNRYKDKTVTDALAYVDRKMKPKLQRSGNQDMIPDTEISDRSSSSNKGSKKPSVKDLTDQQRTLMKGYIDAGVLKNEQEYIDQLVEIGEL